jgi:iron complex outermembrane receptor protein
MIGLEARALAAAMIALSGLVARAASAAAEDPTPTMRELQNLSIEDLANVRITTVAKRPESLSESAAAVFVITREDIRRSGAASVPDALRMAPNLEVARVNGFTWSISARGFNTTSASNKLLVLVDGRSMIEPVGSAVLWQQVDIALDDVERIEVVSGPGGALWGAGAVNGIINIITRRASQSQGLLVDAGGGDFRRNAEVRYGTKVGETAISLYAQGFDQPQTKAADPNDSTSDAFRGAQGGFRLDSKVLGGALDVQGDVYRNVIADGFGSLWGGDVQGRYSHALSDTSNLEVMAYYARDERTAPELFERRDSFDVQLQDTLQVGDRNAVVWGGEVRVWRETYVSQNLLAFATPTTDIVLASVFAQDELALRSDLKLTLGMKLEESSYSGFEWLPSVRLAWRFTDTNLLWGAISRSVRTPDRIERELEDPGTLQPSPKFTSEKLLAFEAGWRGQPTHNSSLSVSAYYNLYDDLRTDDLVFTANGPIVLTANGMTGKTDGVEAWGKVEVVKGWRLSVGADAMQRSFKLKANVFDTSAMESAGQDPSWQAQIRSEANLTPWLELDAAVRSVAAYQPSGARGYTEGDLRAGVRLTRRLKLSVSGQNLFNPRHLEAPVNGFQALPARYVGRTVYADLRWGF